MLIFVLILFCFVYWLLYSSYLDPQAKEPETPESLTPQPKTQPFDFSVRYDPNNKLTIDQWTFDLEDPHIFHENKIQEKTSCFGEPDGTQIKATGKALYDFVYRTGGVHMKYVDTLKKQTVSQYVAKGFDFYFLCQGNRIQNVYTCPPGQLFQKGDCQPINQCTGKQDGTLISDDDYNDQTHYLECQKEEPIRKQCPTDTYFLNNSCQSVQETVGNELCSLSRTKTIFPINMHRYIRCWDTEYFTIEDCPKGTSILSDWDKCYPNDCIGQSDGSRVAMPPENYFLSFRFSTGYYVCKNNKIENVETCPSEWNPTLYAKGENLIALPMVFDSKTGHCAIPSLCENVMITNRNVTVPVYEFLRHVPFWKYSKMLDSVSGFTCDDRNQKVRIETFEPGHIIRSNYRVESGCDMSPPNTKIPFGKDYFDCDTRQLLSCSSSNQPNHIFNGEKCVPMTQDTHNFKNLPIFKFDSLSNYNNWMEPWNLKTDPPKQCSGKEPKFIQHYNVCANKQCILYPFLKQNPNFEILTPGKIKCVYKGGVIKAKEYTKEKNTVLNYWLQNLGINTYTERPLTACTPGQKLISNNFVMNSTIYATCLPNQPFVFCPSSSTKGIEKVPNTNTYACVPRENEVYQVKLPQDLIAYFTTGEIGKIYVKPGALYRINHEIPSKTFKTQGSIDYLSPTQFTIEQLKSVNVPEKYKKNTVSGRIFSFWSNQEATIVYRYLVTYPLNVNILDGKLTTTERVKYENYLTIPMKIPEYTIITAQ